MNNHVFLDGFLALRRGVCVRGGMERQVLAEPVVCGMDAGSNTGYFLEIVIAACWKCVCSTALSLMDLFPKCRQP